MTYEEFKFEVKNSIMAYLTEEYQDYAMKFEKIRKSGYEYDGLLITPREKNKMLVTPTLNVSKAYEDYQNGKSLDDILKELATLRMTARLPRNEIEVVTNYELAKERIIPRLINCSANLKFLINKPFTPMEDLAIIYTVIISEDATGFSTATVTDDLVRTWGITLKELHEQAMRNFENTDYTLNNLGEAIFGMSKGVRIEDVRISDYRVPFFILSNKQMTRGAAMCINPAVMDKIVEKFGDVYILPSSTEEVLVAPQSMSPSVSDLIEMVTAVNASDVAPEEKLSDNVYEYDRETKKLRMVNA